MKTLGKLKTLGLATVLTGTAIGGSIAVAQSVTPVTPNQEKPARPGWGRGDHGGRRGGFDGMRGDRMFSQLNLTEDQKTKIKQIHESFAANNKPLHEQIRAKRQELRQGEQGGTFNESLAAQKLSEIAVIEAKLMGERFKLHQEVLAVLTPEQKTQLEQLRAQFKANRGNKPGRGERRGDQ